MRTAWLLTTFQLAIPVFAGAAAGFLFVGWLAGWESSAQLVGAIAGGGIAVLLVGAGVLRISTWDAARAAERGLAAKDLLTTSLEFTDVDDPLHQEIQDRAADLVDRSEPRQAIRFVLRLF